MMELLGRWLDSRLHLAKFVRRALNHIFPDHWSFMLGEIALYSFVVLVLTGIFLMMFFNASDAKETYHGTYSALNGVRMSAAYESVMHLCFDVPAGLLIRQMHHWAALIFLGAIVTHIARIFFTAAYRRPREVNWIIGLTLLLLALINGYLGYSLPGDLLSGAGLRIAYAILLSVPIVGPWLAFVALGGTVPTDAMTSHMYGVHIFPGSNPYFGASGATFGNHLAAVAHQLSGPTANRRIDCWLAVVAVIRGQIRRAILLCFCVRGGTGRIGTDRPSVDLWAVRPGGNRPWSTAGLVPRLGGGSNAALPPGQCSYCGTMADSRSFLSRGAVAIAPLCSSLHVPVH